MRAVGAPSPTAAAAGAGMRSPGARGRSGLGPCSAPGPRRSPSATPSTGPGRGCLVPNRAALSATLGPEPRPLRGGCSCFGRLGRRVLSPPPVKESALFHNKASFCFVWFLFFECFCQSVLCPSGNCCTSASLFWRKFKSVLHSNT